MPRGVKKSNEPLMVRDATFLDYVEPSKVYRAVIQVGQSTQWRRHKGGRWETVDDKSAVGPNGEPARKVVHIPAIHETEPISGKTLNGLIAKHNQWLKDNHSQNKRGLISKQLLVLSHTETDEDPVDLPPGQRGLSVRDRAIIEQIATAAAVAAAKAAAEK